MIESSFFKEPLSPLEPLLDLTVAQLFIVDGDELIHELQGVEHFVDAVWVDDSGPFHLGHFLMFVSTVGVQLSDLGQKLLVNWYLGQK